MHIHRIITGIFVAVSLCTMAALFVVRVSLHTNVAPMMSIGYGQIAFGYPQGQPGCKGGAPDGTVQAGEECDDGNNTNGDGCTTECTVESGWTCSGSPSSCHTTCGDGIKAGTEACDDGNTASGDGCSATCTVESGYVCTGTVKSACATVCGDGIVAGSEQCDDAGESSTCNSDCTFAACGDGKINKTAGEECDNGNANNNAGTCSTKCKLTTCGDGIIQTPDGKGLNEQCEPSLDSTCTASCTKQNGVGVAAPVTQEEQNLSASSSATRLSPPPSCGNGIIDTSKGEQCDDGRLNGLDGKCDRWCHALFCGNGVVDPGEECEPLKDAKGNFITPPACGTVCAIPTCDSSGVCTGGCQWLFQMSCKASASASASAASIVAQSSESASALKENIGTTTSVGSVSSLTSAASFTQMSVSSSSSRSVSPGPAVCGDGIIEQGEECDNGPNNSNTTPGACRMNCTLARCGDGVLDPGEECDKGDVNNAIGNGCTPTCKISICGNGILEPGEECDDGTRNSDTAPDSCSTHCLMPRCGDGIVDRAFGEICDDGARNSDVRPNACRMNCVPAHCGDGIVDSGEQCDDGVNNSDTKANSCRLNCTKPRCGDYVVDEGEQCDDGPNGSANCTPQCAWVTALHGAAPSLKSPPILLILAIVALTIVLISGRIIMRTIGR